MTFADVEKIALKLPETDRALLASILLESVSSESLNHTPDEFEKREREMDDGRVKEISREDLITRVNAKRGIPRASDPRKVVKVSIVAAGKKGKGE